MIRCETDRSWESAVYTESSAQRSAVTWRGGPGGAVGLGCGGKEVQEGGGIWRHVADALCVQQKLTPHFKAIILQ